MKPLLPLCSIPTATMKDGNAGAYAKILLPFYSYGYWFASGAQYTFPSGSKTQDLSRVVRGMQMTDNYQKDCCNYCLGH